MPTLCSSFRAPKIDRSTTERGSVILFVLGLVLLTSLLLTRFIARAHTELLTEARQGQIEPLRSEAYSALQVSMAVLADFTALDQGLHAPAQGWGDPLHYAEYTSPAGFQTEVKIEDETGKLSLASADAAALQNLLLALDCAPSDADRIIDSILAWTKAEYPAQFADSTLIKAHESIPELTPPHAALRSFDELRLMPLVRQVMCDENGDWNELGNRFRQRVSLFAFSQVNLNTAGPEVLTALGLDADGITRLREQGENSPAKVFSSLADAGTALGQNPALTQIGVDAVQLRIRITTRLGSRKFQMVADVQRGSESSQNTAVPDANTNPDDPVSDPRPWTRNSIDSGFRILEILENNGY
ncbi:MAG: general secretion pathway protein GspK [Cephaloticoccus sp.]|nr:general secretion pathway protein GspK [Cephaloticoccus sp.]